MFATRFSKSQISAADLAASAVIHTRAKSRPESRTARPFVGFERLESRQLMSTTGFSNVQIGTTDTAVASTDTDVNIDLNNNAANLPTSGTFFIQVDGEVMEVTGSQGSLTDGGGGGGGAPKLDAIVTRGADGTTAAAHSADDPVLWLQNYLAAAHLPAPTGLAGTATSSTTANLEWNEVIPPANSATGVASYDVQQWDQSTQQGVTIQTVGGSTFQTPVSGLQPNYTSYFRVRANNDKGPGDWTDWVPVTTPAAGTTQGQPGTPTNLTATAVSTTEIDLQWNPASDATSSTGYLVYMCTDTTAWAQVGNTGATSFQQGQLNPNTKYYFCVFAYSGNAYSTVSNVASAVTGNQENQLAAPQNVTATAATSSLVNVSWDAVDGATGYLVQARAQGGQWVNLGTTAGTTYPENGLAPSVTYDFQVQAYDAAGAESQFSAIASALTLPAAPSNYNVQAVSNSEVDMSWGNVDGITGFVVAYRSASTNWTYEYIAPGQINYAVTGLNASTDYTFYVGAYNASGTTWQNSQDAVTFGGTGTTASGVATPTGLTAQVSATNQVLLTWNASAGATGYIVYYYNNGWQELTTTTNAYQYVTVPQSGPYAFDIIAAGANGQYSAAAQYCTVTV